MSNDRDPAKRRTNGDRKSMMTVRMTPAQYQRLHKLAAESSLSLNEFCMLRIFGGESSGDTADRNAILRELSSYLAREIMRAGDEPSRPATRIQFMAGEWTANGSLEYKNGGMIESALRTTIAMALRKRPTSLKHWPTNKG